MMEKKCVLHSSQASPQFIQSICLEKHCKLNRFLCFYCIHTQHKNHEMMFLQKQFPSNIHKFFKNLQQKNSKQQDNMMRQTEVNLQNVALTVIDKSDELKELIQFQLDLLKDQCMRFTGFTKKKVQKLSPQQFIANILQDETLVQEYVDQIVQIQLANERLSDPSMLQVLSEYQNSFRKILKISKDILQEFQKKCRLIRKNIHQKKEKFNMFEKNMAIENNILNKSLKTPKRKEKNQNYEVIQVDALEIKPIDFIVEIQKNYLKRLHKTKLISKNNKQSAKKQASPKLNQKNKMHSHSQAKKASTPTSTSNLKNLKQEKCLKKQKIVENVEIHQFFDDQFGIPKLSMSMTSSKKQNQSIAIQNEINQQKFDIVINQNQTVYQNQATHKGILNLSESSKKLIDVQLSVVIPLPIEINQKQMIQEIGQVEQIEQIELEQQEEGELRIFQNQQENQMIKQNICIQLNSSSSNNSSSDNLKSQITRMMQEENQRQSKILKMGVLHQEPIQVEELPHRLFSIVIQEQIKIQEEEYISIPQQHQLAKKNNKNDYLDQQQNSQEEFGFGNIVFEICKTQGKKTRERGRPCQNQVFEKNNKSQISNKRQKQKQSLKLASNTLESDKFSIQKVMIQCYDHQEVDNSLKLLKLKDVKELFISTDCMQAAIDAQTIKIIVQMKNLEKLHIYPCSNIKEDEFIKLVKNLKKLKQLVLHQFNNFSVYCADKIAQYLPNIQKISVSADYMNHMQRIQDNYEFLNGFSTQSTFKKALVLSNLQNLQNLCLVNVGNITKLESQAQKMINKMKNLKQLCLIQAQNSKQVNYQKFIQFLSKERSLKFTSIVFQNIQFIQSHLIQMLSRSQFLHTLMLSECPRQFGNQLISYLPKYCKHLQQLSLFQNDTITGQQIFELKQLKVLALRGTWGINRQVFAQKILRLKNLQKLMLNCNNFWFDDSMMEIVCKLKELKTLNIDFNKVTNKGITNLGKLQSLEVFICGNTEITTQALVLAFKMNPLFASSIKKLGLNKTQIQVKNSKQTSPHDVNVQPVKVDLLSSIGKLLPNLTHLAIQGVQNISKQNLNTFENLKCLKYNEDCLTSEAQQYMNEKWVYLNQNPW